MAKLDRPLLLSLLGDPEIEAILEDRVQIGLMLDFERALAEAEADAGLIAPEAVPAIAKAIAGFEPDWDDLAEGLERDGVVVPALVKQLRSAVDAPHRKALHFGATSQDVVDTALMLQLARIIPVLMERLVALEERLAGIEASQGTQHLMAHTRMQQALGFTVADKLRTWSEPLVRHRAALSGIRRSLLVVQLGGPIGDRSSFAGRGEEVARGLARRLDLGIAEPWHSTRDPLVAFGSLLSLISGSLGKFGGDVALMAQNEVHAVDVAGGGGSSAMAHKSNPVNAEVLVALARHNAGLVGTLHQALVHENERSGAAWTLEWLVLPQMLVTTAASLRLGLRLAEQISFTPAG